MPRFCSISLLFVLISSSVYSQPLDKATAREWARASGILDRYEYYVADAYTDKSLGLTYLYAQQTFQGIKVYRSVKPLVFKEGKLAYASGNFIDDLSSKCAGKTAVLLPEKALAAAAAHLGMAVKRTPTIVEDRFKAEKKYVFGTLGIADEPIGVELVWDADGPGQSVVPAWLVDIRAANSPDHWEVRVNAIDGSILGKENFTVYESGNLPDKARAHVKKNETQADAKPARSFFPFRGGKTPPTLNANYTVIPFPFENRFFGSIGVESNPWTKAGATNDATTNGWHFDGTYVYDYTRGNNVYAYDDSANRNLPGRTAISSTPVPDLNFSYGHDFNKQPFSIPNRNLALTNLFYWNNLLHDISYQYGFTEAAGNFQDDNLGRGGAGNDHVNAEAQDGSGFNNANFSTPVDGKNGRMQMYLYRPLASTLTIDSPLSIAGVDSFKESSVSKYNLVKDKPLISGQVVYYFDSTLGTHTGCTKTSNDLTGKIAFVTQSTGCSYVTKIKNAQSAGAVAVIVGRSNGPAIVMGGTDSTITIPAVMISSTDAQPIDWVLNKNNYVKATIPSGIWFDGDLDNGIVSHEYTHGISNRLTGGPSNASCLFNKEQGGEGWSDYMGNMMTTDWSKAQLTDGALKKGHAAYATNQKPGYFGNRKFPYSTDMTINPHTYSDVDDSAYNGEVHYIGEVWCSALWDMTWGIIQQEGKIGNNLYDANGTGGNNIALRLVITGMKLQPCGPGFLDARNAILAADSLLYAYRHKCTIWTAFARRGMGFSAVQGSSNNVYDQVPAFDVPTCSLPVESFRLQGGRQDNRIKLQWSLEGKENLGPITMEKKSSAGNWGRLGQVAEISQQAKTGVVFDAEPMEGPNLYRAVAKNDQGKTSYSNVVSVDYSTGKTLLSPNPVKQSLTIGLSVTSSLAGCVLKVLDVNGKIVLGRTVRPWERTIDLQVGQLAKGTYLLVSPAIEGGSKRFIKE